jgi:VIT1/CCC1 family predicted Fe2+/Mn2+ transporter/predicted Fe-Mo cluster-binding NifX family protein
MAVAPDGQIEGWGRARRVAVAEADASGIRSWEEFDVHWDQLRETGTEGEHHARVARFLREHGAETVLAKAVGPDMLEMLERIGVTVRLMPAGDARQAVLDLTSAPTAGPGPEPEGSVVDWHRPAPLAWARALVDRARRALAAPTSPHETRGASVVRPVVFGATDGLVTNLSLIVGVAAAASQDPHAVLVAGVAGLLAGSFSMAVGEYVSVRSQRELLDYQVELQREQLKYTPAQERAILVEIYESRGLSRPEAVLIVNRLLADPQHALETFVRDEIGLSAQTMGSPLAAGAGSLLAFACGALVPLLPLLICSATVAVPASIVVSLGGLFAVGIGVSRLTHRRPLRTGLRQAALGGLAAAVTYGIGMLLGAAVR